MLDHLFQEPELSFEEGWLYALEKHKVEAAQLSQPELQSIKQDLVVQFGTLRKIFQDRSPEERLIAEPTFISSVYGLQGRLDVLKEFSQQPKRKEIIELKAKKSFPEVQRIGWQNDLIQIACYNLLLDSTFTERRGTSSLLYSKDQINPLRDCGRLNYEKQQAMQMRNRVVRLDWEVSKGNRRIFSNLITNLLDKGLPRFTEEKIEAFRQVWQQASDVEKSYFVEYFGLVMREQIVAKVGGISGIEPSEGFASLWKSSDAEKRDAFTLLDELKVLKFDTQERRLYLQRPEKSVSVTAFREGDIIVLYPKSVAEPTSVALLKGNIVELTNETLTLQLWTTYLDENLFSNPLVRWAIEPNLMEKGYSHQTASLAEFLRADRRKKDLLLGTLRPSFDTSFTIPHRPDLNEEQNQILQKALSARDYFLLQGPPGTGKTSRMLKNMVEEIYQNSEETIVLLAFTNRATDEICEKVKLVYQDNFIRFGQLSPESIYYEQSLHSSKTLKEIRERLGKTRVFVSTVASFLSNFHHLKRFDTLIVDEASQLLEPHLCGIIPKFKRFFLIGDEKQLPAVVTQPQRFCYTKSEELNSIGITDLGQSVFDRLIANANAKNWNDCYAMLSFQFRTHEVIANFFNNQFYKSLQVGSERQKAAWNWFDANSEDPNEQFLAKGRLLYAPTETEAESKFNRGEALKVVELVKTIARVLRGKDIFSEESIGIITPYRAQIAEITRLLPPD
ncbi:MAG: AAA domain-containing protein, partial [Bacteroidota bacterium]